MMAMNISRLRNCRVAGFGLGEVIVAGLIMTFIVTMLIHRGPQRHLDTENELQRRDDLRLETYIGMMADTRPKSCMMSQKRPTHASAKVSIIINFRGFQFYELAMVLKTLYTHTPELADHGNEVIVVDDGTKVKYIRKDLQKYRGVYKHLRVLRLDSVHGAAGARMAAARFAKPESDVLVFMDTTTVVNKGWLQPLIDEIQNNKNRIAVPHFDHITEINTYNYREGPEHEINLFTWALTTVRHKLRKQSRKDSLRLPVMRGNIFAVNRKYFMQMGGYDDTLGPGGGGDLELSFRTWMCGGQIAKVPCSRVGVIGMGDPLKITNSENFNIISKLWVKDLKFQKLFAPKIDRSEQERIPEHKFSPAAVRKRAGFIQEMKCKSFDWYLKTVATSIVKPPNKFVQHGRLKSNSGLCASRGTKRILLGDCGSGFYNPSLYFTLNETGQITNGGLCMTATNNYYVEMRRCIPVLNNQIWVVTETGEIKLKSDNACAMHVTDPSRLKHQGDQIIMLQKCSKTEDDFQRWSFHMD